MKLAAALLAVLSLVLGVAFGQDGEIRDLNVLVGKKVVVQRIPLCQPGTYTHDLTYAGKQAAVVSLKPYKMPKISQYMLNRMPPESRALLEDSQHMATIRVRFEDGKELDSCGPVNPSMLANYFELAPGEKLEATPPQTSTVAASAPSTVPASALASVPPTISPVTAQQNCPVTVTKATSTDGGFRHALLDALTKSQFERAVEKAQQGGHDPHYLDVRMRNVSEIAVRGIEAFVVYANVMGDESATSSVMSQNEKSIKPGGEYVGYSVDTAERWQNGVGDVTVYVKRVRFADNTYWYDNGSRSCSLTTQIKQ